MSMSNRIQAMFFHKMCRVAVILFALYCLRGIESYCDECKTQSVLVEIEQGPVRGYKDPEYDIYAFYDIPYAKAPTGPDRFKVNLAKIFCYFLS